MKQSLLLAYSFNSRAIELWGSKEALDKEVKRRQLETEEDERRRKRACLECIVIDALRFSMKCI